MRAKPAGANPISRFVHIGQCSMDDPAVWIADLEIVAPDEWDALSQAPAHLLGLQQQDPRFSAEHCAIVYSFDR